MPNVKVNGQWTNPGDGFANLMQSGSYGGMMNQMNQFNPKALYDDFQAKMNQANQANETRYQDILAGYRSRRQRALDQLNTLSDQSRKDIDTSAMEQKANVGQDLVSRGLTGTTIKPTMEAGVERDRVAAQSRLSDQLARERIGYDTGMDLDTLQFMERRNDVGPDYGMLMQLAQQMGQGAGGMGMMIAGGGNGGGGRQKTPGAGGDAKDLWVKDPVTGQVKNISSQGWNPMGEDRQIAENIANAARQGQDIRNFAGYGQEWGRAGGAGVALPQLDPKYHPPGTAYIPKGPSPSWTPPAPEIGFGSDY